MLEATNRLRESADFELYELTAKQPKMLDRVVAKQVTGLEAEIAKLKSDAERLGREIGKDWPGNEARKNPPIGQP